MFWIRCLTRLMFPILRLKSLLFISFARFEDMEIRWDKDEICICLCHNEEICFNCHTHVFHVSSLHLVLLVHDVHATNLSWTHPCCWGGVAATRKPFVSLLALIVYLSEQDIQHWGSTWTATPRKQELQQWPTSTVSLGLLFRSQILDIAKAKQQVH